jgi:hypothetical protein
MAGHPLLNQVKSKTDIVAVGGKLYNVHLSYHRVAGVEGLVVGLKFSDESGSMDSAKPGNVNPYALGRAVANKAAQMLKPDLATISILAFYLLTEDLDSRRADGGEAKGSVYHAQAIRIHNRVKDKLQFLTHFTVQGGLGWAMSEHDFATYDQFKVLENELAKQMRVLPC